MSETTSRDVHWRALAEERMGEIIRAREIIERQQVRHERNYALLLKINRLCVDGIERDVRLRVVTNIFELVKEAIENAELTAVPSPSPNQSGE